MTSIMSVFVAPFVVLTLAFAFELLVGLKPLPNAIALGGHARSAVIIVPAHDEELVIRRSIDQLKRAAAEHAGILVVADNCKDETARIARELGVEVIERFDDHRRGKGYALDFARKHLEISPPDAVLIVDADCTIADQSIERLIGACTAAGRPCQATNLQEPGPGASPTVELATFAFFIKNVIRERALVRLAGRAHLLGTGMAFPWPVFAEAELATGNIVEDQKLGQDMADAGHAPIFVEDAAVWSKAESGDVAIAQRRRWEGGFLQNAFRAAPRTLARAILRGDMKLMWAAIDLAIPPFALLIILDTLAIVVAAVFTVWGATTAWPLLSLCAALLLALIMLACTWTNGGSRFVSLHSLLRAPLYVLWKFPLYLGFLQHGVPKEWNRTKRT